MSKRTIIVHSISAKCARPSLHLAIISVRFYRPQFCEFFISMKVCISERHMNVHATGDVVCKLCHIRFTKQSLAIHMKEAHVESTDDEVMQDVSQETKRNGEVTLTEHVSQEDGRIAETNSENSEVMQGHSHRCDICNKSYATRNELSNTTVVTTFTNGKCLKQLFILQNNIRPFTKVISNARTAKCPFC